MDIKRGGDSATEDGVHALIDVTRMPLEELLESDETVLGASLRSVLADLDRASEIIAGFGNYPR